MNLYIETENGQIKNHPAFEENLLQAFGSIPENWEIFERVNKPLLGIYEKFESEESNYAKVDGVWKDVWVIISMTEEEKKAKQQKIKDDWEAKSDFFNFTAWVFDDKTCSFVPPIPYPNPVAKGEIYRWYGIENNWKLMPKRPEGGEYTFNLIDWNWVEVVVV